MNKTLLSLFLVGLLATPTLAFAGEGKKEGAKDIGGFKIQLGKDLRHAGNYGIGIGGGTFGRGGLSGKFFLADSLSAQATLSASNRDNVVGVGVDALLEMPAFNSNKHWDVAWSVGAGVGILLESIGEFFALGVSGVLGVEWNLKVIPLDLVLEFRPTLKLSKDPPPSFKVFTGHVRFYLN